MSKKTKKLIEVFKTPLEIELNKKYTEIFAQRITSRQYNKALKEFLKDVESIKISNPIYHK